MAENVCQSRLARWISSWPSTDQNRSSCSWPGRATAGCRCTAPARRIAAKTSCGTPSRYKPGSVRSTSVAVHSMRMPRSPNSGPSVAPRPTGPRSAQGRLLCPDGWGAWSSGACSAGQTAFPRMGTATVPAGVPTRPHPRCFPDLFICTPWTRPTHCARFGLAVGLDGVFRCQWLRLFSLATSAIAGGRGLPADEGDDDGATTTAGRHRRDGAMRPVARRMDARS